MMDNDLLLTHSDIGRIENAQAVVSFFAQLGYNTDESVTLTRQALGLDNNYLTNQINSILQVATDPEDEEIRVYLFEVRSVTQQLIQTIARRFRERTESALLVLTSDYESLDFVLLVRDLQPSKGINQTLRQIIRPRILTVQRRQPDAVSLRVLKRFTFTEPDGVYQWDKLNSAFTLAEWTEQYFNNRALFSDYYLKYRLTDAQFTPEWNEDVRPIAREVHRLMTNARQTYNRQPESVIRQGMYAPLFARLGFEVEEAQRSESDEVAPDYRLYAAGDRTKPVAVALTYVWNRNLDEVDEKRDPNTPDEIPGAVVVNLLQQAEAPWAIVTNGKLWRLYSAAASNKATNYYEVDLDEAVNAADGSQEKAFKYWWLFFRGNAFTGFLDNLLQRSSDYAKALGDRLKDRVFESIFPHFAKGFVENMRAQGEDEIDLSSVFSGTMTFLYRLMFVLYAESLELLPIYEERGYRAQSLYKLKHEIAAKAGNIEDNAADKLAKAYSASSTDLYERLRVLFNAISKGEPNLNLPQYNGHLFTAGSDNGAFLERFAVPDRYLTLGLDRLARDVDDRTHALALIDYKDLGVRHLGSIYEGLLEFKLRIAQEKLAVIKDGGKEVYLPEKKAGSKRVVGRVDKGEVYLQNDKQERKATGSYYTPDYIVKYIVEHTVGPVLNRKFEELRPRLREAQRLFQEHKKRVEQRGNDQSPELFWQRPEMQRLANDCLDIRVLDPAMGSGHFLVEVVDYVSNRLITFLNGWSDNPVWAMLRAIREDILDEMIRQQVSIDADRLTRVALLKRAVLKRCIYGVDLNQMAVELAKVSLWLDAFTLGAPLSFLDHHLRQGNSLLGVNDVAKYIVQDSERWNQLMRSLTNMIQVSRLADATLGEVQSSTQLFQQARVSIEPTLRRLDIEIAGTLDSSLLPLGQAAQLAYMDDTARQASPTETLRKFEKALQIAERKSIFHWKIEFPEVFIDAQERTWAEKGGFDVVLGNPPYDVLSSKELGYDTSGEARYFRTESDLNPSIQGKSNLYKAFVNASASRLLARDGYMSFIVPLALLGDWQALKLRKWLLENFQFVDIEAFPQKDDPQNRVFPDAKLSTCIFVLCGERSKASTSVKTYPGKYFVKDCAHYSFEKEDILSYDPKNLSIPTIDHLTWEAAKKLAKLSHTVYLGDIANCYQGEVNISSHKKVISQNDSESTFIKGSQVGRYEVQAPSQGDLEYVQKTTYLKMVGDTPKSRHHSKPRIVMQGISGVDDSRRLVSTLCPSDTFLGHSTNYFVAEGDENLYYLLALLNSSLLEWRFRQTSTNNNINSYEVEALPIPRIVFSMPHVERHKLFNETCVLYADSLAQEDSKLLTFVQKLKKEDAVDVIHDLLAFLAQQMIDLNKRKQAEVSRFLSWVEDTLHIKPRNGNRGFDALTGKTILQNYLGDYQKNEPELPWDGGKDGFAYRLRQNRTHFHAQLDDVLGQIEDEYEKSLAVLRPIKAQLAHTDALIDKIVYKLYGLTEEEIELIERPGYEGAVQKAKEEVVDSKIDDDDEAVDALAQRLLRQARSYFQRVEASPVKARLDEALPGWHLYPEEVAVFLLTGEDLLQRLPDYVDFSSAVVSFAKAVEAMIYNQVLKPFRTDGRFGPDDCNNNVFQKFMRGDSELTWGNMVFFLPSSKEQALRRFIGELFPTAESVWFGPGGIIDAIKDQTALHRRNKAAHDQILTRADAETHRQWAIDILRRL